MSEYMERHTVSRLIGAPPGYVGFDQGGLLTDGIDQHPHCVLLLDEIEKAHPDLFNILLQVMDHGKLTDHNGKQVDFRNVILIMTTNAGAADMAKRAYRLHRGTSARATTSRRSTGCSRRSSATGSTRSSPSAICRRRSSRKVVDKFVLQLEAQLADRNVTIELTDEARDWLVENGYDEAMGARPMARADPGDDQDAAGRRGAVRPAQERRRRARGRGQEGRAAARSLGFEYPEGPVTPKPEKVSRAKRAKPRRRPTHEPQAARTEEAAAATRRAAARCRRCRW